jgi:hypothetical protein
MIVEIEGLLPKLVVDRCVTRHLQFCTTPNSTDKYAHPQDSQIGASLILPGWAMALPKLT